MPATRPTLSLVLSIAAAIWALFAGAAHASTVAPCPAQFGSFSASHFPPACWRPYGPTSLFNTELPANPRLAPDSKAIVAYLSQKKVHFASSGNSFAFVSSGRGAVYYSQPSDPVVIIHCTYYWGPGTCQGANGVSIDGMRIHVPAGAQPETDTDHHMTIVDQADRVEYDFEHATWSSPQTLTVWAGGETQVGPNQGTGLGVPSTAAGFSTIAGLITAPEFKADAINHALVLSIPCTEGAVWPVQAPNGFPCSQMGASPGPGQVAPHLGTLFQLNMSDQQIAASGAPPWEQAVMTAMAHYGLYVNDTSGTGDPDTLELETEGDISYTSLGGQPEMAHDMQALGASYWAPLDRWILTGPQIDVSRLRVISTCVVQRTCTSVPAATGHPGAHRDRARPRHRLRRVTRHGAPRRHGRGARLH